MSASRLQESIARRIFFGSFARIAESACVAIVSTRSHHAPSSIISSYIGKASIVWKGRARRSRASSIAA